MLTVKNLNSIFMDIFKFCMLQHNPKVESVVDNGNSYPETKTISTENGSVMETQDKDVVSEGLGLIAVYDQWIAPPISGQCPKSRYEVLHVY